VAHYSLAHSLLKVVEDFRVDAHNLSLGLSDSQRLNRDARVASEQSREHRVSTLGLLIPCVRGAGDGHDRENAKYPSQAELDAVGVVHR
jgi:hypothetical protein